MMAYDCAGHESKDWFRQPHGGCLWWGLPTLIAVSASSLQLPLTDAAFVWTAAFAWMCTGCALNARRCGRLHCYFSAPVLLLGAFASALIGFRVLHGTYALNLVVWSTAMLVALSFVPEVIWGKYGRRG